MPREFGAFSTSPEIMSTCRRRFFCSLNSKSRREPYFHLYLQVVEQASSTFRLQSAAGGLLGVMIVIEVQYSLPLELCSKLFTAHLCETENSSEPGQHYRTESCPSPISPQYSRVRCKSLNCARSNSVSAQRSCQDPFMTTCVSSPVMANAHAGRQLD